jgi:hypothetical protein
MTQPTTFVRLLETNSKTDIALIRSVLESEGVQYYLQGENTITLRPVDPVVLMVADTDALKAVEVLKPLKLKFIESWHLGKE